MKGEKAGWERVRKEVVSTRTFMSLSGSKNVIILQTGVELTLWGNMPEVTLDPDLRESRLTLYAPTEPLDADLTLERGRLILRNKRQDRNVNVRVRFNDPTLDAESHFDITLEGDDAAVILERYSELDINEPFYKNPKDKFRKGPTAHMQIYAYAKSAKIRFGNRTFTIDALQQPILRWQSRRGELAPPPNPILRPMAPLLGTPVLKDDGEKRSPQERSSKPPRRPGLRPFLFGRSMSP